MSKRAALVLLAGIASPHVAVAQASGTTLHGDDGSQFGFSLASVGDVDGDGNDDVLVGAINASTGGLNGNGRVSLYSGATMAWIRDHDGAASMDAFGYALAGAGDVDLDGTPDYVVGAPFADASGKSDNGLVVVYSGATGAVIWSCAGPSNGVLYGYAVCGVGDLDGSGRPDVLATESFGGTVLVFDDAGHVRYSLGGTNHGFGASLAKAEDLDGDGVLDWYAGAPGEDSVFLGVTVVRTGAVYAISGATGNVIWRFARPITNDYLGDRLDTIGDLDGDGLRDVVAGAPHSEELGPARGAALVLSGAAGTLLQTQRGTADAEYLGGTVAGMGDMDHDGVPDYAVGSPGAINGSVVRGAVQVFSGSDASLLYEWLGGGTISAGNHELGAALASGDWNGDGIGDLILGDPGDVVQHADRTTHPVGEAAQVFGCPAWSESYGSGWPGKNGVPALVALNDPSPGSPLTVELDDSLGAATFGLLLVGLAPANVPTGKGGTLLVSPGFTIPAVIPPTNLTMTATLPNDPALDFVDLYLQGIEADAFASKGMSFTAGLRLRIGVDLP